MVRPTRESLRRATDAGRRRQQVSIALVHHANQYIITNGYLNREGLDEVIGGPGRSRGYFKILDLHRSYRIPLNLHLSGTLLEAVLWYRPDFLSALRAFQAQGLLELVGSAYGQNIMRFFSEEHNLKQLNEQLRLYRHHLKARNVKVFWPPERVWDTGRLSSVLTNKSMPNGGYQYVLLDDRLLYPLEAGPRSRQVYDQTQESRPEDFAPHPIRDGHGLTALFIANQLRQNIPPCNAPSLETVSEFLAWLRSAPKQKGDPIAIYADDLEKSSGVGGWDERGPSWYEVFLQWIGRNRWVHPVKLGDWTSGHDVGEMKRVTLGTFFEMSNHFGAGEDYEKWYFDPKWDRYRSYCAWSEARVKEIAVQRGDPALIELAWKHLLASSWETAWHTPPSGVHGDARSYGEPSPWARATASHSRAAAVIAEAALWIKQRDKVAHAYMSDIDNDGETELILTNNRLFAVLSPSCGARLTYLFTIQGGQGKMVIGNPCDDWNWMEELNKYMEVPANHPGALADIGCVNDRYNVTVEAARGIQAKARLLNVQNESRGNGLEKTMTLAYDRNEIEVTYKLPAALDRLTIECGFSPDYLDLLRSGDKDLTELRERKTWGYANNGVAVWIRVDRPSLAVCDQNGRREFGHGRAVVLTTSARRFTAWVGAGGLTTGST